MSPASRSLCAAAALVLSLTASCRTERPKESPPASNVPPPARAVAPLAPAFTLPPRVTFAQHIAPILYQHCSRCHRIGEAGPFPLMSYRDAALRAPLLAAVTKARYMPPWPADPGYSHFADENVLT